jgi:DNA-binding NarL/FixJ family response regulator
MSKDQSKPTVVVRDTQAGAAEDLRTPLAAIEDRELPASFDSKEAPTQLGSAQPLDFVIVDEGFGTLPVLMWIHDLVLVDAGRAVTAWSVFLTEAETPCLLRAGVGGIIRSTADLESILSGLPNGRLRTVPRVPRFGVAGALPTTRTDPTRALGGRRGGTGFKNRAIALELGIRCGAAKIHVKHIFEENCPMRAS